MAQQIINVGAAPNDGTGDPLQTAFTKSNDNFTELYARGGGGITTPQGRLTLQPSTPVMTTTQSAKTTIYYTPYVGDQISLYNGTAMVPTTFAGLNVSTLNTANSPAAIGASKVNDWFVWDSGGGLLRLVHGPDWTDDTTRSAGTALVMINGILLNAVAITNGPAINRGTYVGTTRSNASSTLDWIFGTAAAGGGEAVLGLWNRYNRVSVGTTVRETTQTWVSPGGIRPFQNAVGNRVSAVFGLAEDVVATSIQTLVNSTSGGYGQLAVGLDSTTVFHADCIILGAYSTTPTWNPTIGKLMLTAPVGFHFWQALELAVAGTITMSGVYATIGAQAGFEFAARM